MRKLIPLLVIFQLLFVGLDSRAHSVGIEHDQHEGAHIHFEHSDHALDTIDSEHDSSSHVHLSLSILPANSFIPNEPRGQTEITRTVLKLISQTYSPPVPPPNH